MKTGAGTSLTPPAAVLLTDLHGACAFPWGTQPDTRRIMARRPPLTLHLQTPRGELIGEARLLERYRISFELSAPLRPGDAADFRVALPVPDRGPQLFVHGSLRVLRILDAHPDAPSLFSAEILQIRAEDRNELDAWLATWATESGRRFEAMTGSSEWEPEVDVSESSHGWTDALDSSKLPQGSMGPTVSGFSAAPVVSDGPLEPRLAGREAIRTALRRGLPGRSGRGARMEPSPPARGPRRSSWLIPSRERARRQIADWMKDFSKEEPRDAPAEPEVSVDLASKPTQVEVVWRTLEQYGADYKTYLCSRGLFIVTSVSLTRETPVAVLLVKPDGGRVRCAGMVVAPMPTGLGLSVDLDDAQLQDLGSAV